MYTNSTSSTFIYIYTMYTTYTRYAFAILHYIKNKLYFNLLNAQHTLVYAFIIYFLIPQI